MESERSHEVNFEITTNLLVFKVEETEKMCL